MNQTFFPPNYMGPRQRQRGISLFVILIAVLLSMLLALWASRTALFNEMIVGNDADYQRAFEAAQAMIQDAELDIRRQNPDGTACTPGGSVGVCRTGIAQHFPAEDKDLGPLLDSLGTQSATCTGLGTCNIGCSMGLCQKRTGAQDFWNNPGMLNAMIATNVGARYGQFTGAQVGNPDGSGYGSNPILNDRTAGRGAWYWIEVMPYVTSGGFSGLIASTPGAPGIVSYNLTPNVVYRITAIARGRKASTQVVLQQVYVPQKLRN